MQKSLKLIVEQPTYDRKDYDVLTESVEATGEKHMFIKGPFTEAESRNRNQRIYPLNEMIEQVEAFDREYIQMNRATGELEHPEYPNLDARKACHLITEIHREGNLFIGKSKILSTPDGKIVESLLRDGVQLGVSSRSLGNVDEATGRVTDFQLCTFDIVHDPSCQKAFVNGIMESREWICNYNAENEKLYEEFDKTVDKVASSLTLRQQDDYLFERCMELIRRLK